MILEIRHLPFHIFQEEKDGIETSDNFDGKAQDIEKPEDDEEGNESENDEEEEDDADMEMGETEPGADKLESEVFKHISKSFGTRHRKKKIDKRYTFG